jgi:hypothetical protein
MKISSSKTRTTLIPDRYGSLTIAVNYYHVAETENQEWTILFQYIDLKMAILNLMKIWFYHKFNG